MATLTRVPQRPYEREDCTVAMTATIMSALCPTLSPNALYKMVADENPHWRQEISRGGCWFESYLRSKGLHLEDRPISELPSFLKDRKVAAIRGLRPIHGNTGHVTVADERGYIDTITGCTRERIPFDEAAEYFRKHNYVFDDRGSADFPPNSFIAVWLEPQVASVPPKKHTGVWIGLLILLAVAAYFLLK